MKSDVLGLPPSQIAALIERNLTCDQQYYDLLLVTGIPGVGKTNVLEQTCDRLKIPYWVIRPIQHESIEYTGLPTATNGQAHWVPFGELLPTDPDWEGVIFFDEITQLDVANQKVIASLLDKQGPAGRRIPKGARFVLAGNRQQDRAGASRLISIIESRCTQVEMLFSLDDWRTWALNNDVHEYVHGFGDFKGASFIGFDSAKSLNPLPRTWEKVSNKLHKAGPQASTDKNDPIMLADIAGSVGAGPANEFLAFREHYATLHGFVDAALQDPHGVSVDKANVSACHCMIGALATRTRDQDGKLGPQATENLVTVAQRFSDPLQIVLGKKMGRKTLAQEVSRANGGMEWLNKVHPHFEKYTS